MLTTPFPEPEAPELERFTIYSRNEIVALLRQLREDRIAVTVYFAASGGGAEVRVLAVKPDFEELVCALPAEPAARDPLLACESLVFVAFVDRVKLQFAARAAESIPHDGQPAFRVRLPDQMLRLQRRDYFRVPTPDERPATCLVPWTGAAQQYESVRVTDISVGGLALVAYPQRVTLPDDGIVPNCFLDLPGVGSVVVTLRLRHLRGAADAATPVGGCEFFDPSPQSRLMIQRYVNRLDGDLQRRTGAAQRAAELPFAAERS